MMSLFRFLLQSLHFCCPAEFLHKTRTIQSAKLAAYLGIHPRTVRYWRLKYTRGELQCEHCPNCLRRPGMNLNPQKMRLPTRQGLLDSFGTYQPPSPSSACDVDAKTDISDTGEAEVD